MFRVETEFPIAFDSPDHLHPWGTKRDNHTSEGFVQEIISRFLSDRKIKTMDLGCSGGGLVKSWLAHTEYAIGLEGSDYSVKNERAEWPELYNKNLFTCDVSRPYQVYYNDEPYQADIITAWELIEHIEPSRVDTFFDMVDRHLKEDGVFCGSGTDCPDAPEGHELHLSAHDKQFWDEQAAKKYYTVIDYPFGHSVRTGSYLFCYKKSDPNKLKALF